VSPFGAGFEEALELWRDAFIRSVLEGEDPETALREIDAPILNQRFKRGYDRVSAAASPEPRR
jgi:hypothetical protein